MWQVLIAVAVAAGSPRVTVALPDDSEPVAYGAAELVASWAALGLTVTPGPDDGGAAAVV